MVSQISQERLWHEADYKKVLDKWSAKFSDIGFDVPKYGKLRESCRDELKVKLEEIFLQPGGKSRHDELRKMYMVDFAQLEFKFVRTDEDKEYLSKEELWCLEAMLIYKYKDEERGSDKPRLNDKVHGISEEFKQNVESLFGHCIKEIENGGPWHAVESLEECADYVKTEKKLGSPKDDQGPQGVYFFRPRNGKVNTGYIGLAGEEKKINPGAQGLRQRLWNHFLGSPSVDSMIRGYLRDWVELDLRYIEIIRKPQVRKQAVRIFGKIGDAIDIPDLVAIQKSGYEQFLQKDEAPTKRKCIGLEALFREIFPIESYDKNMRLEYLYYELERPHWTPTQCRQLRLTYGYPLKIWSRLRSKDGGDLAEQAMYLGEMPVMIGGGEFIINGAVRVIVNQLHRSPGVDFLIESKEGDRVLHGGRIIPERGSWIEISVTHKDILVVKIDQSSKIPATVFLRAMDTACGTTDKILRLFYQTKTVPVTKLTPAMWAVTPIADPLTGEVIVKASAQIGDKLSLIQNISLEPKTGVTQNKITEYLRNELEFKYVSVQNPFEDDEKKLKSFLEFIENRIMLLFQDSEKDDEKTAHLPRFNTKNNEVPKNDKKKISEFEVRWDKEATKEQKDILEECEKKINDKTAWYSDPKDAKDKNPDFKNPGLYFFRNKKTKDVKHGYIGYAGERRGEGLYDRMANSHYSEAHPDDSLRKRIEEFLIKQLDKGEKEDGKAKKSKKSPVEVEVIDDVRDTLILNTLGEDDCPSHEQALLKFYVRLRPGNPPNEEKAKIFFAEKFFDPNRYRLGKVGRFRLNRKFGQTVDENEMTLRPEDFLNTMKYILALRNNEGELDDIDHLGNRRLRTIDELAADEIRKGLLKLRKTVQERMSYKRDSAEPLRIADLINSKSVSSSINYFFGRGELSQVVDQTNALSQLTHERRLSALGPGGLNRRRAGFEVRDVHISHYGRICPIETPEGTNIGLIASLAIFATIDEYGFLLTPYRKVKNGKVTDEVAYLRADEEMKTVFAPPSAVDPESRKIKEGLVLARKSGELAGVSRDEVDYIDISPKQTVGVSAALIPFLEHDDANRALMGSNMQRQAVPLLKTEPPSVCTGLEKVVGQNSSMVVRAETGGVVTAVDATKIVINHTDEYELAKFVGLNERTCLNQKPVVNLGEKVQKGQIIADGGGTANGVLALGKNILVGFVSFDGFNFEDAIVVSEKLCKNDSFTSIHIDEFAAEVRETRLGKEEFTRDIPNVSERALRNLDEHGVVREGTRVCTGDILVGKVVPKSKTELTPEEKLLHAIFGRAGEDVKNDSLELPSGYEGVVMKTERFTRRGAATDELKKVLAAEMKQYEYQMKAKQCVTFRQMSEAIHKKFDVDIIDPSTRQKVGVSTDDEVIYEQIENFNIKWVKPASIRNDAQKIMDKFWTKIAEIQEERKRGIERLKHGDELPSGVQEMVKVYVAIKRTLSIGDKIAGRHGNKGVIAKIVPEEDMPFLEDGTSLDILLNPLGVPSRMNVGQILETHLGWAAKVLGFQAITPVFDGGTEDDIRKLTGEANELMAKRKAELEENKLPPPADEFFVNVPKTLKTQLYDGRTGQPFDQEATIGYIYIMKLHHLVDDKIHARSTGPYSLITQQPLGGKARTGGQRFGEMEVWALEGYGAAFTLQEMLTVKSDDVEGRTKIYESMVKGQNTLEAGTPLSFDVLCHEIRGLGLNIQLEKKRLGSTLL
jgi:DNA-directed RNA polymerase subunit beta